MKIHYKWPFSIAMLVYQRVITMVSCAGTHPTADHWWKCYVGKDLAAQFARFWWVRSMSHFYLYPQWENHIASNEYLIFISYRNWGHQNLSSHFKPISDTMFYPHYMSLYLHYILTIQYHSTPTIVDRCSLTLKYPHYGRPIYLIYHCLAMCSP